MSRFQIRRLRLTLKHHLLLCGLLGAVIVTFGFSHYQSWNRRQSIATPKRVLISHVDAETVAALLREAYPDADITVVVEPETNSLAISGSPSKRQKLHALSKAIDQPAIAQTETLDCFPETSVDPVIVEQALQALIGQTAGPDS